MSSGDYAQLLKTPCLVLLDAAPVYHGLGAPRGDGSAGILIPGLLCPDHYLFPLAHLGEADRLMTKTGFWEAKSSEWIVGKPSLIPK